MQPDMADIEKALSSWVPKFTTTKWSAPLVVGFISACVVSDSPPSKSSKPSSRRPNICYDTETGSTRPIGPGDPVIRSSREDSFYVMQTLRLGSEEVLTFYDSGANTHLIEGECAEELGLTVLSDKSVQIGTVGGGSLWSEYGQYAAVLGPDIHGQSHELECQGVELISRPYPEFDF